MRFVTFSIVSLVKASGRDTFSARSKAEMALSRVSQHDAERSGVCNIVVNVCGIRDRENSYHISCQTTKLQLEWAEVSLPQEKLTGKA